MQYCNSVLVLLSEIFDNLQAVYQRICHELNRGLGRTFSERDWVNQQRNLGEAARKETTRRRKTFRVSEEDAEGISSMARLQMTRGQLGQSQNAENAAGSNPSRSTAHVEEEEEGEQGARLEAAKGGRLISPAFTIFFKTKLYLED